MKPPQGPPQIAPVNPEKGPILTFEKFKEPFSPDGGPLTIPRYQNFYLYFARGAGAQLRKNVYYFKFAKDYPEMAIALCLKIQGRNKEMPADKSLQPFEADLYEAYKIMRSYGATDEELFTF